MTKINLMIAVFLIAAMSMFAAGIDGKWTSEITTQGKKGETKVTATFDLKSSGETLTGIVTTSAKRTANLEITDGKLAGNQFSFKTKQTNKRGETIIVWEGTVDGDSLNGSRGREGAKNKVQFTAKRL